MERKQKVKKNKSISYRRDHNNLPDDVRRRCEEKIRLCGGINPYSIKEKDMSLASKDFPAITVSDIANYMISSTSPYTKLPFNAYKSTQAYTFFESGLVQSIASKRQNEMSILKGRVRCSQTFKNNQINFLFESEGDAFPKNERNRLGCVGFSEHER